MTEKRRKDDSKQSQRFVETAQDIEADESGKAFEKAIEALKPRANQNQSSDSSED